MSALSFTVMTVIDAEPPQHQVVFWVGEDMHVLATCSSSWVAAAIRNALMYDPGAIATLLDILPRKQETPHG